MIKTSRNLIINVFILFLVFILSGCSCSDIFKVEVIEVKDSYQLSIDEKIIDYLDCEDIPTYDFQFEGSMNITENKTGNYEMILYGNDDFLISKIIENTLSKFDSKHKFTRLIGSDNEAETWMNYFPENKTEREKYYIKIKDNKVYNEIAYLTLDNGLQLSIIYARFTDFSNVTYYRWQKTENIRIILHYPLMVYKNNELNKNRFVIFALPNGVIYHIDTTSKNIQTMIENDEYLSFDYYTFSYVNSYEENFEDYANYYLNELHGKWINSENKELEYTYLGHMFKVTFTNDNFNISIIK